MGLASLGMKYRDDEHREGRNRGLRFNRLFIFVISKSKLQLLSVIIVIFEGMH